MAASQRHDPFSAALEVREQLALRQRRLGFLFGAGTSMAVGMPGIGGLTEQVGKRLDGPFADVYQSQLSSLPNGPNVEDVLNRVRLCREIAATGAVDALGQNLLCKPFTEDDIPCTAAPKSSSTPCELDRRVCRAICELVNGDPPDGIEPHETFARWLRHARRDYPVEVFTTNYDLILERAMEGEGTAFFDGFLGSVHPFFCPESVEADGSKRTADVCPPPAWVRLWKLHGSIGWRLVDSEGAKASRVTRVTPAETDDGADLLIFPSREKYMDSRKAPFLTYQDRLRRFLCTGEALLVVVGYRFADQHINEILFEGLRANTRLAVTALCFEQPEHEVSSLMRRYPNLSCYGPAAAVVGGQVFEWNCPPDEREELATTFFWDSDKSSFALGDFRVFTTYLSVLARGSEKDHGNVPPAPNESATHSKPKRESELED